MAVEERFGIEIANAEAEKVRTPGDLIALVLGKVQTTDWSVCLSRRAFYAIRRVLMKEFGVKRAEISPTALLEPLVPRVDRQKAWQQMKVALQAERWPELGRPGAVLAGLACLFAAVAFVPLVWAWSLWITVPLAIAVWRAAFELTRPLGVEFRANCATVGQLANFVVGAAPKLFEPQGREFSRAEIVEGIRRITIDQLGLKPEQYREDARFVEDLGMD
ncbi:MAG: hypothetical protein NTW03_01500 [Verrucomicrobia bacterium]|nr:hypothetical protein [Verrucomicrobiota bacterium]